MAKFMVDLLGQIKIILAHFIFAMVEDGFIGRWLNRPLQRSKPLMSDQVKAVTKLVELSSQRTTEH
jgi:hypothetical protein